MPARQVRRNIDAGNIRYVYFFQGNSDGADKTCQLLQMVLLANIVKTQTEANDWRSRLGKIGENKDQILADVKRICLEERIKVFFLPTPPALQYCIHNASSDKSAKVYPKQGDEFIEWLSGKEAYQFWDEIRQGRGAMEPLPSKAVLYGVSGFKVGEGSFFNSLKRAVDLYFPGIEAELMRLCLERPAEVSRQG